MQRALKKIFLFINWGRWMTAGEDRSAKRQHHLCLILKELISLPRNWGASSDGKEGLLSMQHSSRLAVHNDMPSFLDQVFERCRMGF